MGLGQPGLNGSTGGDPIFGITTSNNATFNATAPTVVLTSALVTDTNLNFSLTFSDTDSDLLLADAPYSQVMVQVPEVTGGLGDGSSSVDVPAAVTDMTLGTTGPSGASTLTVTYEVTLSSDFWQFGQSGNCVITLAGAPVLIGGKRCFAWNRGQYLCPRSRHQPRRSPSLKFLPSSRTQRFQVWC